MAFHFNFFKTIEDRYKTRISLNKPIIIRLDGKNVCKNPSINLTDEREHQFAFSLNSTAKSISRKFNAICTSSTDEINIIILNPNLFFKYYNTIECQKISSFIAQEVSTIFNNLYSGDRILFDARTFNIPENKVLSYLNYRIGLAKNVYTIYYAKKLLPVRDRVNKKVSVIDAMLRNISYEYSNRSTHNTYGAIYFNGSELLEKDLPETYISISNLIELLSSLEATVTIYDDNYLNTNSNEYDIYDDYLL